MKQLVKKKNESLVLAAGRFIFCDSRMVADKFEVEHKKVVRTIDRIKVKNDRIQGDKLSASINDFSPVFYKFEDEYQGQKFTAYRMNKTAFSMVAMRFSTDNAFIWQIKFVEAFAIMESEIYGHRPIPTIPPPMRKRSMIPEGMKCCSRCREILPCTPDYFYSNVSRRGGRESYCIDCHKKRRLEKLRLPAFSVHKGKVQAVNSNSSLSAQYENIVNDVVQIVLSRVGIAS